MTPSPHSSFRHSSLSPLASQEPKIGYRSVLFYDQVFRTKGERKDNIV